VPEVVNVPALLEATRGRPLRGLVTLEALLAEPPPPDLEALVQERLEAIDPRLKQGFGTVAATVKRVRSAWLDARAAAARELEKK
jgi:hypothetical protein